MRSFESMKRKLEQTGLYNVSSDSNIAKELNAYAEGLDTVFDGLSKLEKECYIETAEDYGLEIRESFIGEDRSDMSIDERRSLLETSEQITGDCTVEAFKKILTGYGLKKFSITESYGSYSLTITISDDLSEDQKSALAIKVNNDFPLHLNVKYVYA